MRRRPVGRRTCPPQRTASRERVAYSTSSSETPKAAIRWSRRRWTTGPTSSPENAEASCITPCSEPASAAEWPLPVSTDGSQPIIT